jgi:hypothetical protein
MEKYNVYIVAIKGGKAEAKIGENMTAERAEVRVLSGLQRIDRDNYFVTEYEVGSERDLEANKQVEQ